MADYAPPTLETPTPQEQRPKDEDLPAYRYAKALCESARSNARPYVGKFKGYWDFLMGKGHWRGASTVSARLLEGWSFRGVVNDLYAVVDTKCAAITGASSKTFVEPLGEDSTYYQRLQIKSAIDHELERLRFRQVRKDCYLWGSACGIGIAMLTAKPDSLTGDMALNLKSIDPTEFFWDPSADNLKDSRFCVWEPLLDMSVIRQMWPSKAPQVKPNYQTVTSDPGSVTYTTQGDTNLLYGTTGEYVVDSQNTLKARRARVAFVWVRDPDTLVEELRETVLKEAGPGYECQSCGTVFEQGDAQDPEACQLCGGNMEPVTIPAKVQTDRIMHRAYPYGRLTVYSGNTLLYDGENPYELEEVFPFYAYHHYRLPGVFPGFGDVALLRSLQEETNTTVGQVIDYVRLAVNGPFIYPMGFKSFTSLGNGPAERHPGPDQAQWLPQFVTPNGFNVGAAQLCLGTLNQHFLTVSGLGDLSGAPSSPPISATEVEVTASRLGARMKGHAYEFGCFCSDVAQGVWQLMKQFYTNVPTVSVEMPSSEVKGIEMEMADLPLGVRVRISIGLEEAQMDKLQGQNLAGFVAQGGLQNPDADIILEHFGLNTAEIKELMARRALRQEIGVPPAAPTPQGEPIAPPQLGGMQ